MKILFLDFDGVVNSGAYRENFELYEANPIEPQKLELIKRIADETSAKIVLTSTWRKFWREDGPQDNEKGILIERLFGDCGLKVCSKTPELDFFCRDKEVKAWLESNPEAEAYCVLDDLSEFFEEPSVKEHLVLTNSETGITEEDVSKAIGILNEK
ncbi:MAG: hypothetical protein KBS52_04825 [Clostridiales bacterium]|nr:hypothetical protein [Candidatus Equinaster intestinalis]